MFEFEYIQEAKARLWEAFQVSALDIMKEIQVGTTSKIMAGGGKPQFPNLFNRSGDLVRNIQSPDNMQRKFGETIEVEKKITVPYGYLVSGEEVPITGTGKRGSREASGMRAKLWSLYFAEPKGSVMKGVFARMALFQDVIKGRDFIHQAIENVRIDDIIKKHIKNKFPDKKKEETIGGK